LRLKAAQANHIAEKVATGSNREPARGPETEVPVRSQRVPVSAWRRWNGKARSSTTSNEKRLPATSRENAIANELFRRPARVDEALREEEGR
jgi:hypothetical protein